MHSVRRLSLSTVAPTGCRDTQFCWNMLLQKYCPPPTIIASPPRRDYADACDVEKPSTCVHVYMSEGFSSGSEYIGLLPWCNEPISARFALPSAVLAYLSTTGLAPRSPFRHRLVTLEIMARVVLILGLILLFVGSHARLEPGR